MALTEAVKEAIYLKRFLEDMGFKDLGNITLCCDNFGAIKLTENPTFHGRSKHIDIRHHFVRDVVKTEDLVVTYVPTEDMVADFLTKTLPRTKHQ